MSIERIEKLMIITYPSTNKASDKGTIVEINSKERNCCSAGLNIDELKCLIEYLIIKYENTSKITHNFRVDPPVRYK